MKSALLILALVLLVAQSTFAQEAISFQGRLTGPDGTPVADGSHSVRFQLFDDETGGEPVWGEAHAVRTTDGVFSAVLGSENMLNLDLFDEMPYLLLIVEGEEMEPRVPLTAVPYAVKSYRLDEAALVAGANVSITQRSDGALQIGATGGGGGTGGLTSVASDATLAGDGTSGSPLQVADGAVTGVKLADDALVGGTNVTITRQAGGALEVKAAGGGLSAVTSDATLAGDGTAGSPLQVATPLELIVAGVGTTAIRGRNTSGTYGYLGGPVNGVWGEDSSGNFGALGSGAGAYGYHSNSGNYGSLGNSDFGAYGRHDASGNYGYLGGSSYAVYGEHDNGNWGALGHGTYGVFGFGQTGFAAAFNGNVTIIGNLAKSSGSFKIDHPLDPANKYLSHSFVESPDMMNVYNGNVTTDANGEAVVTLPDYFAALNRDFRYQLTVIGQFAQAIVAEEMQENQFVIRTDHPHVKVSWQVTGIRQDAWAEENRILVEEDKPASEQGFYLHPKLFGQPQERSVEWARDPEGMRELEKMPARLEAEQARIEEEAVRSRARPQDN